jgi:hypothetical protein
MPTAKQLELHAKLHRMFGRTDEFRAVAERYGDFRHTDPTHAYTYLSTLMLALQRWKFKKLPRYAGLPRTAEERRALLRQCLREERKVRIELPEEKEWVIDTRPSAFGNRSYFEQNPELKEALEMDRGFFRAVSLI